jgi:hypothetical protein
MSMWGRIVLQSKPCIFIRISPKNRATFSLSTSPHGVLCGLQMIGQEGTTLDANGTAEGSTTDLLALWWQTRNGTITITFLLRVVGTL